MRDITNKFALKATWVNIREFQHEDDPYEETDNNFLCDLSIRIDGQSVTANMVRETGTHSETTCVSALPLIEWLCYSFWRILYEPAPRFARKIPHGWRMAHNLQAVAGGYAWPHIQFASDCKTVSIKAKKQSRDQSFAQSASYINDGSANLPVNELKGILMGFFDDAHEHARTVKANSVRERIELLKECSANRDKTEYHMIEAMLGYDSWHAPLALMDRFCELSEKMLVSDLAEIAGGLNPVYGGSLEDQASRLNEALASGNQGTRAHIDLNILRAPSVVNPWELGRILAQKVREKLGIGSSARLSTEQLTGCAGLRKKQFASIRQSGSVALCHKAGNQVKLSLPAPGPRSAISFGVWKRFQLARALGAFLSANRENGWLAITRSSSWTQQVQRNFASELLAPLEGIMETIKSRTDKPEPEDIEKTATHFGVSNQTIIDSLLNQHKITRNHADRLLVKCGAYPLFA